MNIEFNMLDRLFAQHQEAYEQAALRALRSGWYIIGSEVAAFEEAFANRMGTKHCVGLNSGLDALILTVRALGIEPGDEIIVPSNTYIATVLGITENGATPVFVEPDEYFNIDAGKIEAAITDKTKAILAVHLYGQAANIEPIVRLAKSRKLYLIEDCAQSHTARFNGKATGTFGDVGCFSFFPTKNLGAFGDAGAIITDNEAIAEHIRKLRNYGSTVKYHFELEGVNSRLDEIQAALLNVRLSFLDEIIAERKAVAARYLNEISNARIILPHIRAGAEHIWHLFVIQTDLRDNLQGYLLKNGIKTQIHYPVPPHLSPCYRRLGYEAGAFPIAERMAGTVLSLPLYNGMNENETECVVNALNKYE